MNPPYGGVEVAFLTRHGKQHPVRGPLERALGCRIAHTDAYDTDLLGTFTGEVARAGSALDAARRKAVIGMELLGLGVGIGSEGTFGADPVGGLLPWDLELLVWVDRERGIEVVGTAQGPAMHGRIEVRDPAALDAAARRFGAPSHGLVLRPVGAAVATGMLHKGLGGEAPEDRAALRAAFGACLAASPVAAVAVETDLRAHFNPTRRRIIEAAAADLARRLAARCPACEGPGYGRERAEPGLSCAACGAPTRAPSAEILACPGCGHRERRPLDAAKGADPATCDLCNP